MKGAHNSRSVLFWRGCFVAAGLVQLVVLYFPRSPSVGGDVPLDKVVHVAVFGAVAVVAPAAVLPLRPVVVGLAGHAVISELVQDALFTDRSGELADVIADLVGVGLGAGAALWLRRREARRRRQVMS
ncbi:MAG: VanZ family protein [Actinomycetota bacterium]